MLITAQTRLGAVIGSPIHHSLSPALYNAAFAAAGLDWVFVAFDVASGLATDALAAMRVCGLGGLSVTMPHKEVVFANVDVVEQAAAALRSVNCVVPLADGRLLGCSTDGDGYVDSLRADAGVDPAGRRIVVVGAGGAARSIVDALARAGAAEIVVVNRTADKAHDTAMLAGHVGRVGQFGDIEHADIVVNATSIGMNSSEIPFDASLLHAGQTVSDIVYQPLRTALLGTAAERGAAVHDGLGMLVHQAVHQFRRFTGGVEADPLVMRAAAMAELANRATPAN